MQQMFWKGYIKGVWSYKEDTPWTCVNLEQETWTSCLKRSNIFTSHEWKPDDEDNILIQILVAMWSLQQTVTSPVFFPRTFLPCPVTSDLAVPEWAVPSFAWVTSARSSETKCQCLRKVFPNARRGKDFLSCTPELLGFPSSYLPPTLL